MKGIIIVYFSAVWCGPCHYIKPFFVRHSDEFNLLFVLVDIDEISGIRHLHNIDKFPTFIAFREGREVDRIVGSDPESLLKFLERQAK